MKTIFFKGTAVFFILLVATSVLMDNFKMDFGTTDFFQNHGYIFLLCISVFPRLTLLFSSVLTGGFIWWLGFFFCPRVLVATLATVAYFHTNPILVIISWLVALGGEVMEKKGLGKNKFVFKSYRMGDFQGQPFPHQPYEQPRQTQAPISSNDIIEAEFTKKD